MRWDWMEFISFVGLGLGTGAITVAILSIAYRGRPARKLIVGSHSESTSRATVAITSAIGIASAVSASLSTLPHFVTPESLGPAENLFEKVHWSFVIAFVSMLFGMAFSYLNRLINERRAKIEEMRKKGDLTKPGLDFDLWDFVQPFLVSIITFGAIVARVSDDTMWTNVLLGFETGFFWQTILSNRSREKVV